MKLHILRELSVFSTYVEVILNKVSRQAINLGILHVCGGDPIFQVY